jgi:radical SAM superfamily enzyme with C-terminal helix-hairpin-helix motif
MFEVGTKIIANHHRYFTHLKNKVKKEVEFPLLKKMLPEGTEITDVYTETYHGNLTFGRQLGSYPILIGIPGKIPLHRFITVKVVDYGYRSITGIPYPLDVNNADIRTLEALPGIGRKRAYKIVQARPITDWKKVYDILDEANVVDRIKSFFK